MPRSGDKKATVLVVDGYQASRTGLGKNLGAEGYEVIAVPTGKEAVEAMQDAASHATVVLVDDELPDMTGGEFARALATTFPHVNVVHIADEVPPSVAPGGNRRVLTKPLDVNAVIALVDELVANDAPS